MGAPRYADLICIGSQKAGTTWLHRMLAGHPDVFAPVLKEIHYFDTLHVPRQATFQRRRSGRSRRILHERVERTALHKAASYVLTNVLGHREARRYVEELRFAASLRTTTFDDAWYASFFASARPDQLTCDFTPAYSLLPPKGIEHLRRLNPEARIIYILRDPVERALSHARMLIARNGAPQNSDMLRRYLVAWAVRSRDDCTEVIDRWQAHWPRDQFRIFFFDDIASRPLELLEEVCKFAELKFDRKFFPGYRKVIYPGPRIPASRELRAETAARFAPLLNRLQQRYPKQTAGWGRPSIRPDRVRRALLDSIKAGLRLPPQSFGWRPALASGAVLSLLVLGGSGGYYAYLRDTGNVHMVVANELYRSAQPSPQQLERYRDQYGIRTVINLRGESEGHDWYDAEVAESRKLGITHVDFRMSAEEVVTQAQAANLIALFKTAEKPVLIHCQAGADRSGLAAALYVAAVKKLGENAAEEQLSFEYGHVSLPFVAAFAMDQSFEQLEPWLGFPNS